MQDGAESPSVEVRSRILLIAFESWRQGALDVSGYPAGLKVSELPSSDSLARLKVVTTHCSEPAVLTLRFSEAGVEVVGFSTLPETLRA